MSEHQSAPATPLPPAPGADAHVGLELANSAVRVPRRGGTGHEVVELLPTPAAATGWLVAHGLAPRDARLQQYCADRLTTLRGTVRELLAAAVDGRAPSPGAVEALNRALTRTPTVQLVAWNSSAGFHTELTHPTTQIVEHALAAIAGDVVGLLTGPDAALLAACGAEPCNRYMLRTHGRRHWCSTRCGDRVRAARSYARRTQVPA
ncbi:CGNR zinc finger domain-containing protein [Kineococcus sp. SYSU DK003]|uniref:CGNR zinc finger domain-containing protein n=1 Tax=Kineococcus sp. SYSU DK003 TaxID=3383124 RepID=UPI003D7C519A